LNGQAIRAARARRRRGGNSAGAAWQLVATLALIAFGLSLAWLPIAAPAAVAVLGFALGCWWSGTRARQQLELAAEQQKRSAEKAARSARLLELANRLSRIADADAIVPLVVETALWLTNAERAAVFHVDKSRRELWTGTSVRAPVGAGIVGAVAKFGEPIAVADPFADQRFDAAVDGCVERKPRSQSAWPIRDGAGTIIGVLALFNKRGGDFTPDDIETVTSFLAAVAAVFERGLAAESKPK
jgi:hypothetical protein